MPKLNKSLLVIAIIWPTFFLSGCSKTLDFRNAEISNNKIYSTGENTGFSGKITNIPLNKIPVAGIGRIVKAITDVTQNNLLSDVFIANSISGMFGKGDGGVLCDTYADDGILNGDTECKLVGTGNPLLKFAFKSGAIDGKLTIYDVKNKGKATVDAIYSNGKLNGPSKIYSANTGKVIHKVTWENGTPFGTEEEFDGSTGNLISTSNIENGKYNGEVKKFSADGKLISSTIWKDGENQSDKQQASNNESNEKCVDLWMNAFRKENGEDAMISADQLEEWGAWCQQGKTPSQP